MSVVTSTQTVSSEFTGTAQVEVTSEREPSSEFSSLNGGSPVEHLLDALIFDQSGETPDRVRKTAEDIRFLFSGYTQQLTRLDHGALQAVRISLDILGNANLRLRSLLSSPHEAAYSPQHQNFLRRSSFALEQFEQLNQAMVEEIGANGFKFDRKQANGTSAEHAGPNSSTADQPVRFEDFYRRLDSARNHILLSLVPEQPQS